MYGTVFIVTGPAYEKDTGQKESLCLHRGHTKNVIVSFIMEVLFSFAFRC